MAFLARPWRLPQGLAVWCWLGVALDAGTRCARRPAGDSVAVCNTSADAEFRARVCVRVVDARARCDRRHGWDNAIRTSEGDATSAGEHVTRTRTGKTPCRLLTPCREEGAESRRLAWATLHARPLWVGIWLG